MGVGYTLWLSKTLLGTVKTLLSCNLWDIFVTCYYWRGLNIALIIFQFNEQRDEEPGRQEELRYFKSQTLLKIGPCLMVGAAEHVSSPLPGMRALMSIPFCSAIFLVASGQKECVNLGDSMLSPKWVCVLRCTNFVQAQASASKGLSNPMIGRLTYLPPRCPLRWHLLVYYLVLPPPFEWTVHFLPTALGNYSKWPWYPIHLYMALSMVQDHEHQCAISDVQFIFDLVVTDEWMLAPWLCKGIWNFPWGYLIDQSKDKSQGLPFAYTPHSNVEIHTH